MKVRIKFRKYGVMKFIGHLDIMRYFQKAMRRANIPMKYSQGFTPHMIMSFANPLGVGLTSDGEYFDIETSANISSDVAVKQLNEVMVEGMEVLSFRELPDGQKTGMAIVAAADYEVFSMKTFDKDFIDKFNTFIQKTEILITKKTKKSEREVDLKPMIYKLELLEDRIFMQVATGSVENLKPDLVMEAFMANSGFDKNSYGLTYNRVEVYAKSESNQFVTLESLGTVIESC